MTDRSDTDVDVVGDEFERLGRRAGAELRLQPPADGPGSVLRSAHRRRATAAAVAAGVTVAIVVTGLLVANSRVQDAPAPVATLPSTPTPTPAPAPVVPTTTPSEPEDVTAPDALRTTTPGTWRDVTDPLSLAPGFATAAVWTGTEAIVVGSSVIDSSELSPRFAVAYDVAQDRWRRLADLPPALSDEHSIGDAPALQWTGSEVLTATSEGEVYSYDPVADRWDPRARPDESMSLPAADALVAVSVRGVLARSSVGWWWYENSTDRWESVAAPSSGLRYSKLSALDQDSIVATNVDGATVAAAVFDIASRTWRTGPAVEDAPVSGRSIDTTTCDVNDGLLVCSAEGYGGLDGVVIDPLVGRLGTFELGNHSQTIATRGLPWLTHGWKLLSPRTATWEDLPPSPYEANGFSAAVWTGSEIIFFGGTHNATVEPLGATAAYTPLQLPGR